MLEGGLCWKQKKLKVRKKAGLHDNHAYEAQRVTVIRDGWKVTWGLEEKTALTKGIRDVSCLTETFLL